MATIKIGDKVRFMNEVGGGRVTAIVGKDMVNVETEDGFEVPTYIKNLVVVGDASTYDKSTPSGRSSAQNTVLSPDSYQEKPRNPGFVERNQLKGGEHPAFIFALVPEKQSNPTEGKMNLFLVNDCNYTVLYHFSTKSLDQYETLDTGHLEPNTKVELATIFPGRINDLPSYCFQLLYFKRYSKQLEEPVQKEVVISSVKFFKPGSFVNTNYFKEPAMLIQLVKDPLRAELDKLTDKEFRQITAQKESPKPAVLPLPPADLLEIDLHIGQLLDDFRGLGNTEMLKVQMDHFRKELEKAIATGVKRIVFIHGVGDGVLKNEVRRELQRKYSKYNFQDASFREYGFGATMVILRK